MIVNKVTIKDIAETVGVSRTAVSFVINGRAREKGVSQKLEKKILQVAQSLNYKPSILSKSLQNKSMTIAAILPNLSGSSALSILKAIDFQVRKSNYQLLLAQHENNHELLANTVKQMLERNVDGFLMMPTFGFHKSQLFRELKVIHKPVVYFERSPDDPGVNIVTVDVAGAVTTCMQHLYDLGHRRIALCNPPKEFVESRTREIAYRVFCQNNEIEIDEKLIIADELTDDDNSMISKRLEKIRGLFSMDSRPTAAVAVSSTRAINIYQTAINMGVSVPKDFSLVAITDMQFTEFHKAIITSARFSYEEIGKIAFQHLLEFLQDPTASTRKTFLPATLVMGNTTTKPKLT